MGDKRGFVGLFLNLGWSIIPLSGKKPLVRWEEFRRRKPSFTEIQDWRRKYPESNWGIICGPVSGVIVWDADTPEIAEKIRALLSDRGIHTWEIQTRRGVHFYFRLPSDAPSSLWKSRKDGKVDVKGEGGYVVAPGSVHPDSGQKYRFLSGPPDVPAPATLSQSQYEDLLRDLQKLVQGNSSKPNFSFSDSKKYSQKTYDLPDNTVEQIVNKLYAFLHNRYEQGWRNAYILSLSGLFFHLGVSLNSAMRIVDMLLAKLGDEERHERLRAAVQHTYNQPPHKVVWRSEGDESLVPEEILFQTHNIVTKSLLFSVPPEMISISSISRPFELRTLDSTALQEYAEFLEDGETPPPIVVGKTLQGQLILIDGSHRIEVALRRGESQIQAYVVPIWDTEHAMAMAANLNRRHGVRLTRADRVRIVRTLKEKGWTPAKIIACTGFSKSAVYRYFKSPEEREAERVKKEEIKQKIRIMAEQGKSLRAISREMGVSKDTVRRWLKDHVDGTSSTDTDIKLDSNSHSQNPNREPVASEDFLSTYLLSGDIVERLQKHLDFLRHFLVDGWEDIQSAQNEIRNRVMAAFRRAGGEPMQALYEMVGDGTLRKFAHALAVILGVLEGAKSYKVDLVSGDFAEEVRDAQVH